MKKEFIRGALAFAFGVSAGATEIASRCQVLPPEIASDGYAKLRCKLLNPLAFELITATESVPRNAQGQKTWSIEGDLLRGSMILYHAQLTINPDHISSHHYRGK